MVALPAEAASYAVQAGTGARSHPDEPSCAVNVNCGGGGALSGGSGFASPADCASGSVFAVVPVRGWIAVPAVTRLPVGVSTAVFRPPQSSWV